MRKVYLLRHAEKDDQGELTKAGEKLAKELGESLPKFSMVISSDSSRAKLTAFLITGIQPKIDPRAGFNLIMQNNNNDVIEDFDNKAEGLNQLVNETLTTLEDEQSALIVSHDITIGPAMALRVQPERSVDYLSGYIIDSEGGIRAFTP